MKTYLEILGVIGTGMVLATLLNAAAGIQWGTQSYASGLTVASIAALAIYGCIKGLPK